MKTLTALFMILSLSASTFANSAFTPSKGALMIQELSEDNAMESYVSSDIDSHELFNKVSALAIKLEYDFKFDDINATTDTAYKIHELLDQLREEAQTTTARIATAQIYKILTLSYRAYTVEQIAE